jgi:hypothetical protein
MVKWLNCLKYCCYFLYCKHNVNRDILITLYKIYALYFSTAISEIYFFIKCLQRYAGHARRNKSRSSRKALFPIFTKILILRIFFLKSSSFKCLETLFTCSRIRTGEYTDFNTRSTSMRACIKLVVMLLVDGIAATDLIRDRDTSFLWRYAVPLSK